MHAPVSLPVILFLLLAPAVVAILLVRCSLSPRGLGVWSFVTIPLLSVLASSLCLIVELMVKPDGLKRRVAHILFLAAIAAVIEELAKGIVFFSVLRRRRATLNDTASIVAVGLLVGLGSSFFENLLRAFDGSVTHAMWSAFLGRAMLSTPGHAAYTGLLAFTIARRRVEQRREGGAAIALLFAMLAHMTFDTLGLAPQLASHRFVAEVACRSVQVVLVYGVLGSILWRSAWGATIRHALRSPVL